MPNIRNFHCIIIKNRIISIALHIVNPIRLIFKAYKSNETIYVSAIVDNVLVRYMLYPRRVLILEQAENKSALESNSQHMTVASRQQLTAEREREREEWSEQWQGAGLRRTV